MSSRCRQTGGLRRCGAYAIGAVAMSVQQWAGAVSGRRQEIPGPREIHPKIHKERAMTIQVGDKVPAATLKYLSPEGPKEISTDELFGGKKVAIFAVPGAFTPTCSQCHLPGHFDRGPHIKVKDVDTMSYRSAKN